MTVRIALPAAALLSLIASPAVASDTDYATAVKCAGTLAFMATVLPPGSENAADAQGRSAAWQAEAIRIASKPEFDVRMDVTNTSETAKTVIMGGDEAAMTAFMQPLVGVCENVPSAPAPSAGLADIFGTGAPSPASHFDNAVTCAGRYGMDSMSDATAQRHMDTFRALAERHATPEQRETLTVEIAKATSSWTRTVLSNDAVRGAGIIGMCDRALRAME